MPNFNITIARVDAGLTAQATGQGAFPLVATSDTEFHFQEAVRGLRVFGRNELQCLPAREVAFRFELWCRRGEVGQQ